MKAKIKHLQQMKHPNAYPASSRNYKSFRTTDGWLICRWCNRFGDFARAWETTSRLQRHPRVNRIPNTSIYLRTHHSTHNFLTYPINAFNMLLIKQTTEGMTLWNILTHKMLSILITRRNHHSHLPIKPTTSIKLEGLISQVSTRIIITWSKTMLYRTDSASYQAT